MEFSWAPPCFHVVLASAIHASLLFLVAASGLICTFNGVMVLERYSCLASTLRGGFRRDNALTVQLTLLSFASFFGLAGLHFLTVALADYRLIVLIGSPVGTSVIT